MQSKKTGGETAGKNVEVRCERALCTLCEGPGGSRSLSEVSEAISIYPTQFVMASLGRRSDEVVWHRILRNMDVVAVFAENCSHSRNLHGLLCPNNFGCR